jgi:hypothetical protein
VAQPFSSVVVDVVKLQRYCLSEAHPRGRHKARVFRARFGLTALHADQLRQALIDAVLRRPGDLHQVSADRYGARYVLDFNLMGSGGSGLVRSAWIVRAGEDVLRFVSCYPL